MLPKRVEDWTYDHCNIIKQAVDQLAHSYGFKYTGIYVTGSYCFNVYKPGDLDLIVMAPEIEEAINLSEQYEENGRRPKIFHEMAAYIQPYAQTPVDLKIYRDSQVNRSCDLGFEVPYYDVLEEQLYYKSPYATIPFSFQYDASTEMFVTYTRDKRQKAINKILS